MASAATSPQTANDDDAHPDYDQAIGGGVLKDRDDRFNIEELPVQGAEYADGQNDRNQDREFTHPEPAPGFSPRWTARLGTGHYRNHLHTRAVIRSSPPHPRVVPSPAYKIYCQRA
jgi:hypothetical protein